MGASRRCSIAHFSDVHALSLDGRAPWRLSLTQAARPGISTCCCSRARSTRCALFEAHRRRSQPRVRSTTWCHRRSDQPVAGARVRAGARDPRSASRSARTHVTVVPGNHDVYTLGALQRERCSSASSGPTRRPTARARSSFPLVRGAASWRSSACRRRCRRRCRSPTAGSARRSSRALEAALRAARRQVPRRCCCTIRRTRIATSFLRGLRDRARAAGGARARRRRAGAARPRAPRSARRASPGPSGADPGHRRRLGHLRRPAPRAARPLQRLHVEGGRFTVETRVHDLASGRFQTSAAIPALSSL